MLARILESRKVPRVDIGKGSALAPWMSPEEFSQLLAVLHSLAPRQVLEWGSGGSTDAILRAEASIERYVSVEHDREWSQRVRKEVRDERLELHHVGPDEPPEPWPREKKAFKDAEKAWHTLCEQRPEVMKTYIEFPLQFGQVFDLALVDGRARRFCLRTAWEVVRPGGIILVHDAQRTIYHDVLHELGEPRFLEPWSQGQICILRREADLSAVD